MNLKSFGCSFIYGSELADQRNNLPSKLTWPAHLANHLGYNYECYSQAGSGNLQIAEKVLNQPVNNDPSIYVIGWSWIDRFDYSRPVMYQNRWATIVPSDDSALAQIYYRDLHSEYRDKLTSLMTIRLVIDTLKQKNIPFIMTYMDELLFDQQWHTTPAVIDLQNYIKPCMTTFEGKSFLDWSRAKGYPETAAWHPLEEAHRAAGEYIVSQRLIHSA